MRLASVCLERKCLTHFRFLDFWACMIRRRSDVSSIEEIVIDDVSEFSWDRKVEAWLRQLQIVHSTFKISFLHDGWSKHEKVG